MKPFQNWDSLAPNDRAALAAEYLNDLTDLILKWLKGDEALIHDLAAMVNDGPIHDGFRQGLDHFSQGIAPDDPEAATKIRHRILDAIRSLAA